MAYYQQLAWQTVEIIATVTATTEPATGIEIIANIGTLLDPKEPSLNEVKEIGDGVYVLELATTEVSADNVDIELTTTTPGVELAGGGTITLTDPASLDPANQYCTITDLYRRFGTENANTWADYGNERNTDEIAQQIVDVIVLESQVIDATFRNKGHDTPFSPIPDIINQVARMRSGVTLHDQRGIEDNDDTITAYHAKMADRLVRQILGGQLELV